MLRETFCTTYLTTASRHIFAVYSLPTWFSTVAKTYALFYGWRYQLTGRQGEVPDRSTVINGFILAENTSILSATPLIEIRISPMLHVTISEDEELLIDLG